MMADQLHTPNSKYFIELCQERLGITDVCSKELAHYLDAQDPLRHLREKFHVPKYKTLPGFDASHAGSCLRSFNESEDDEAIYLCGNSLGLMPKRTETLMKDQFEKWQSMGVFGHFAEPMPWAHCDERCIEGVRRLVGAESAEEIALMNSLTVNIHLLFIAFYRPDEKRYKVLLESRAFPSDHYAIESQIVLRGLSPPDAMICLEPREGEETLRTEDILRRLDEEGDSIAMIFLSGVQYFTGQLFEMERITSCGHAKGCIVGWDLAHAFANVPLQLHKWDVDFACWCTYKYGCSGAGGIGGVVSNPSFATSVGLLGFLETVESTSMQELRKKSILLTGYLEFLLHTALPACPESKSIACEIITPEDPTQRGCQLSLKFNCDIRALYAELVKLGVAVDKRFPYVIRVAPVHLYNSFWDVWRFVHCLKESMRVVCSTEDSGNTVE